MEDGYEPSAEQADQSRQVQEEGEESTPSAKQSQQSLSIHQPPERHSTEPATSGQTSGRVETNKAESLL